ncbi:MAG: EFR1 family ferrodoxin [Clostridia bacterium]|nr:EFR1 family ferrodoxin [Clostridia bacterium]
MKNIVIVYFTGTNGTKMAAEELKIDFGKKGMSVQMFSLDLSKVTSLDEGNEAFESADRLVVMYPVYSFDAPKPIFRWIKTLPEMKSLKTAVISVSGGGDERSNRTCRNHCIRELEKKGCKIDYETMITMPSNFAVTAPDQMNQLLIRALSAKAAKISEDILRGIVSRRKRSVGLAQAIMSFGFNSSGRIVFGKSLNASSKCTDCKWCQNNCPTQNILIENGKMKTLTNCTWCMRCVYGCPVGAISAGIFNFSILKEGFSLKKISEQSISIDTEAAVLECSGWNGVKHYINENLISQ